MMKKVKVLILGLISVISWQVSTAQQDPQAKEILTKLSAKYDAYQSILATFELNIQNTEKDRKVESQSGTLYLNKKANKYKMTIKDITQISDGTATYTIMVPEKEIQIMDVNSSSTEINPSNIFSFYKSGFKYVLGQKEPGASNDYHIIELTPINTDANYYKIKLRVNKSKLEIYDATIFSKNGMRFNYVIKTFKPNSINSINHFTFNKSNYPGFEIVDLR